MREKARVKFLAGTMSVLFHMTFLILLSFVQASGARLEENNSPEMMARVGSVKRIIQAPPTAPKPKIQKIASYRQRQSSGQTFTTGSIFDPNRIFVPGKVVYVDINEMPISKTPQTFLPVSGSFILKQPVDFFGSRTDRRWICYLVDCSGSMSGMFGWVRQQLKDSISRLQQDHYFRIIFFGNDKIFEFGEDNFIRANGKNKSLAYQYIDSVGPAGGANAIAALAKAIQTGESRGQVIYLLTDGFELVDGNISLEEQITDLLKNNAPGTQINTIGFWPQEQDRVMLETLAQKSGGEFILVIDEYQPENAEKNKTDY